MLGGLPLVALLASALTLAIRHLVSSELGPVELCSFAVILLAGLRQSFLVHERGRLLDDSRGSRDDLEIALIQRAEADSRYQTLVERVPAAVYIDVADPGVTDGGHLAYMSPQIEIDPGLSARGLHRGPGALAEGHASGRPRRNGRRARRALVDRAAAPDSTTA